MKYQSSFSFLYQFNWILIFTFILLSIQESEAKGAREPGELTWGQMATNALLKDDVEGSITLFEMWLEANPNNNNDWYNYSCALSLHGDTTKALAALSNAIKAGYRDSAWAANDSDLSILRGLPDFNTLLSDMSSREQEETKATSEWRYLPQTRQGRYLLRLPDAVQETTGTSFPAVMLLHGRGSNAERYVDFAERLDLPDVIFIIPEAPYACDDGDHGFEYWPRYFGMSQNMVTISQQCSTNASWLTDILRDAATAAPIDSTRIIVTGFSQGGASSYMAVLEFPEMFLGAAPLGGWLFEEYADIDRFRSLAANKVSLFIGHGREDKRVELKHAEEAKLLADTAGIDLFYKTYPVGHRITTEMIVDLRKWILDLIST